MGFSVASLDSTTTTDHDDEEEGQQMQCLLTTHHTSTLAQCDEDGERMVLKDSVFPCSLIARSLAVAMIVLLLFGTQQVSLRYMFSSKNDSKPVLDGSIATDTMGISEDIMTILPHGEENANPESSTSSFTAETMHPAENITWNHSSIPTEKKKHDEDMVFTPGDPERKNASATDQTSELLTTTVGSSNDQTNVYVASMNSSIDEEGEDEHNEDAPVSESITWESTGNGITNDEWDVPTRYDEQSVNTTIDWNTGNGTTNDEWDVPTLYDEQSVNTTIDRNTGNGTTNDERDGPTLYDEQSVNTTIDWSTGNGTASDEWDVPTLYDEQSFNTTIDWNTGNGTANDESDVPILYEEQSVTYRDEGDINNKTYSAVEAESQSQNESDSIFPEGQPTATISTGFQPSDDENVLSFNETTPSFATQDLDSNITSTWDDPLEQDQVTFTDDDYQIHVVYNDWKYRRVCALVGESSHLCMTVRYPIYVSPMDLSVDFASPTETRWYTTHKSPTIVILDGADLETCNEKTIKECLDYHFDLRILPENEYNSVVIALYTKTFQGRTSLFGTSTFEQLQRFRTFFRNQVVIVFGASPSPPITECMKTIFGTRCDGSLIRLPHLANCTTSGYEDEWIILGQDGFYPQDINHGRNHSVLPGTSVDERLLVIRDKLNLTSWNETNDPIRFTVIIEHPIAHTQNQPMMQNDWGYVVSLQDEWTRVFLDSFQDRPRREKLARQGIEIENVIAFDGSPQFFPTESGGFVHEIEWSANEQIFLEKGGYDGWDPKYGSTCSGPLHPTSNMTKLKDEAQQAYERNGLDMRWYGRAWEFMNLVWFDVMGWNDRGMDCTHTGKVNSALSCMHKFFLMAMVDDYYDNVETQSGRYR